MSLLWLGATFQRKVIKTFRCRQLFQFFIVCALLVAAVAAQDEDTVPPGRTRICKEGEFPGKRNRRQAGPAPDAAKPCWFIPDETITKGEDCEKRFEETQTCEKSQVFVPLGQVGSVQNCLITIEHC